MGAAIIRRHSLYREDNIPATSEFIIFVWHLEWLKENCFMIEWHYWKSITVVQKVRGNPSVDQSTWYRSWRPLVCRATLLNICLPALVRVNVGVTSSSSHHITSAPITAAARRRATTARCARPEVWDCLNWTRGSLARLDKLSSPLGD